MDFLPREDLVLITRWIALGSQALFVGVLVLVFGLISGWGVP